MFLFPYSQFIISEAGKSTKKDSFAAFPKLSNRS